MDAITCTHLAAPNIVRTEKFICALAHAPTIVSTDFIDDCLDQDELLDPDDYLLDDEDGEKRLGYKLSDSLRLAQKNKGKLLKGYAIYCTESIHGGFETYRAIINVNGGKCHLYRARAGSHTGLQSNQEEDEPQPGDRRTPQHIYLISGVTPEEARLWPKFRQMAAEMGKIPRVVRNDWMLNLALSQEVHWKDTYALTDNDIESDA